MSDDGVLQWGALTNVDMRLQFPNAKFDRLSFGTTPIDLWIDTKRIGHASGFFWRKADEVWLVTNWHNVTANNPFTRLALGNGFGSPTRITCYPLSLRTTQDQLAHFPERTQLSIELFDDNVPTWTQHKDFERVRVDIAALCVATDEQKSINCINDYRFAETHHHVGADLYVVGYPLYNYVGWMPPLWKRGSFAGEPLLPMADKPLFPIDVASAQGMSGSAIFRRVFGPRATPDGSEINLDNVVSTEFVGVYAGSLADRELTRVGIGYGWYGYLVDEIIDGGSEGSTC